MEKSYKLVDFPFAMFAYQRVSGWVYNSNFIVELMVYIELVDGVKIKQQTKLGGPPCTGFPLKKWGYSWKTLLDDDCRLLIGLKQRDWGIHTSGIHNIITINHTTYRDVWLINDGWLNLWNGVNIFPSHHWMAGRIDNHRVLFGVTVDLISCQQWVMMIMMYLAKLLVGGFKHVLFSISHMGCHPSHWRSPSFFKMGTLHHQAVHIHCCFLQVLPPK